MEKLCNIPEEFLRKVQSIKIYRSKSHEFNAHFRGDKPLGEAIIEVEHILPGDFDRHIKRKSRKGSYYYKIELSFGYWQFNRIIDYSYTDSFMITNLL